MEDIKLLQQIGLTELESRAYLTLLKQGSMSAGALAKKINVQRSTVYYLLDNLREKGLIGESIKGKNKMFKASNPKFLEQQARETYKKIKEAIPKMIIKQEENEDEVLLFKGYKGLKSVYEEMLVKSKKGDEFLIMGSRGGEDISTRTYRNFYKNFNDRRIKKKIKQRIIMNADLKKEIGSYYKTLAFTKVRYLKQKTLSPVVVFPKVVVVVQWKDTPTLYMMKGDLIVESFKQYFEELWKNAN